MMAESKIGQRQARHSHDRKVLPAQLREVDAAHFQARRAQKQGQDARWVRRLYAQLVLALEVIHKGGRSRTSRPSRRPAR